MTPSTHPAPLTPAERAALRARFEAIKAHYLACSADILESADEWGIDPYAWEACPAISLTPIEVALWHDIRAVDVVVYPQYPVGRYFVDFGNPAAGVAIECDGARWHLDKEKDAERDAALKRLGWSVYRISGRECLTDTNELRDENGRLRLEISPARKFIQSIADKHPIGRNRRDLNLDRIKAEGRNSAAESARMLAAHANRERAEIEAHLRRPEMP